MLIETQFEMRSIVVGGPKRIVSFVADRTHNYRKGTHNILQCYFFSSGGLVGRTRIARRQ